MFRVMRSIGDASPVESMQRRYKVITRIPQRTVSDCAICVVAMVTGYPHERVSADSGRYVQQTSDGKFYEWWVDYLQHQGWKVEFRPFTEAYDLWKNGGQLLGILGMTIPRLKRRHVVVVEALGVVDPASGCPDHLHLADYIEDRLPQGVVFDTEFLAIHRGQPA
jgi:hypothetical protein